MKRMANRYDEFMSDTDQESRRRELRDFFGPNAGTFLKTYDRLREASMAAANGRAKFQLFAGGFEPAAFFCGPVWFFYRKMWAWAWGLTAVMVALGLIPMTARIGPVFGIVFASGAHRMYVLHAIAAIHRMRGTTGAELNVDEVRRRGGVSKTAGWIAGGVYALLLVIVIVGAVLLVRSGASPN